MQIALVAQLLYSPKVIHGTLILYVNAMNTGDSISKVSENIRKFNFPIPPFPSQIIICNTCLFIILGLILLGQTGCYNQGDAINPNKVLAADSVTIENVTYDNYVHDVLKNNCSTCHGSGGSAEVWWLNTNTYENAVEYATPITNTMINGTMPPPPKFPLYDRDRALLASWIKRGMPESN